METLFQRSIREYHKQGTEHHKSRNITIFFTIIIAIICYSTGDGAVIVITTIVLILMLMILMAVGRNDPTELGILFDTKTEQHPKLDFFHLHKVVLPDTRYTTYSKPYYFFTTKSYVCIVFVNENKDTLKIIEIKRNHELNVKEDGLYDGKNLILSSKNIETLSSIEELIRNLFTIRYEP